MSEVGAGETIAPRGLQRFEWRAVLFTVAWGALAIIYTVWAALASQHRGTPTSSHDLATLLALINAPFPIAFLIWGWLDKHHVRTRMRRVPFLFAATFALAMGLQIFTLSVSNILIEKYGSERE